MGMVASPAARGGPATETTTPSPRTQDMHGGVKEYLERQARALCSVHALTLAVICWRFPYLAPVTAAPGPSAHAYALLVLKQPLPLLCGLKLLVFGFCDSSVRVKD